VGSIPASRTKFAYATLCGGVFVGGKSLFLSDFSTLMRLLQFGEILMALLDFYDGRASQ
jgi:hypothetical protein